MESIAVLGAKHGSPLSLPSQTKLFREMKISRFPLTSFPRKQAKLVFLKATPTCDDRTFKKMPPSEWTNHFDYVSIDVSEMEALKREIEALKPNVGKMFMSPKVVDSVKKRILSIYLLVSLGLAYHFEDEIEESLRDAFEKIDEMMAGEEDLYTVSTIFWVFRTYGYKISSEVFTRFKEDNGIKFKQCLTKDVRGMLSLYEAAHMVTTTEYIMDEALSFSSSNLVSLAEDHMCPSHILRHIKNALTLPQRWNMEVIVAVEYIRFYEQEVGHDEMILKFAKLNFNLIQRHYLQELKILTKWYKDYDFLSNLPRYYREVIVEMHFFSQSMFFEPRFSRARIMQTKFNMSEMLIDDTCDRYATLPEIESLVNSLERWAPDDAMDSHPGFLNFVFKFMLDVFEDCERELRLQERTYSVEATKDEYKVFMKSNLDFAKLASAGHMPSFDKYMEVGKVEIGGFIVLATAMMGIDDIDEVEGYSWLKSRSKLLQSLAEMLRLMNDKTGYEIDMNSGYVTTGMNCYMNQFGVTEKEVSREFQKMIEKTRKVMNEEFLKTSDVSRRVLKTALDLARAGCIAYTIGEGVTNPRGIITKYILSLYVDQICF
ncbi:hypothetical protein N665_0198s0292 [Sinapis alba]|nr:hypothetical protein N665_0198s0292 [Sinapis alba]